MSKTTCYGVLAEFDDAVQFRGAALRARHEGGYRCMDVYSPFPVEGLDGVLGDTRDHVPLFVLLGGICGGVGTFALEWYSAVLNYPINVGGRPTDSWQAFLPPALEMTILFAVLFGVLAMLLGNRLPRLHHPLFGVEAFERASRDHFFLLLRADDPEFDADRARIFLESLSPLSIEEVTR